jgi:hypothetical protein
VDRQTRLQVDLSVRGARTHQRGEFSACTSSPGWMRGVSGGILGRTLQEIPRSPPSRRARRRAKPSLRANSASPENISFLGLPPRSPELDPAERWFSRVQAKFVEQDVRERGPNTRGADEGTAPVLGDSFPPQTAYRLLMVGKGGRGVSMTSINRNGITISKPPQSAIIPVIPEERRPQ